MARAINLDALRSAEVHTEPWRWAHYAGAFLEPEELAKVYPSAGMVHEPKDYTVSGGGDQDSSWSTLDTRRTLVDVGTDEPMIWSDLDERWLDVAADLVSPEYREALSEVVGIDLADLTMRAVFHTFNETYSCRPHLDDESERVVHLLYLDGTDSADRGGFFQVLTSSDPKDLVTQVPPTPNQSIIQVRTDNSWHAVSPPAAGSKMARKMLHITWEDPLR